MFEPNAAVYRGFYAPEPEFTEDDKEYLNTVLAELIIKPDILQLLSKKLGAEATCDLMNTLTNVAITHPPPPVYTEEQIKEAAEKHKRFMEFRRQHDAYMAGFKFASSSVEAIKL